MFEKKYFDDVETALIQRVGAQPKVILKSELPEKANKKKYIEFAVVEEKVLPPSPPTNLSAAGALSRFRDLVLRYWHSHKHIWSDFTDSHQKGFVKPT